MNSIGRSHEASSEGPSVRCDGVEIRQLRYFVAVAEELSFTRAATRIPVAVGALSTQIRRLESELGVGLLERTTHSVTVTPAGEQFLALARDVLGRLDGGVDSIRRSAPSSTLTIGIVEEGLAELTGPVLDAFRSSHPRIQIRAQPCPASFLFDGLDGLDAIFWVHPCAPFPDWDFEPIIESDAVVVVATDHPLANHSSLEAADVIDEMFVRVPEQARAWFVRHHLDDHRGSPASRLSPAEVRDVPAGQSLVSIERSVMVQPIAKLRYFNRPGITGIPLTDVRPFPLGIAHRTADARPAIRSLVAIAREIASTEPLGAGTRLPDGN